MATKLDAVYNNRKAIQEIANFLRSKARAFGNLGNDKLEDELFWAAEDLDREAEEMYAAYTAQIDGMFQQSQQASANMLSAALAGIICAKEDKS